MPLFYFHVREGLSVEDDEGQECDGTLDTLREEAIAISREMIAEAAKKGINAINRRVEVANEAGETILSVPFSDALADEERGG